MLLLRSRIFAILNGLYIFYNYNKKRNAFAIFISLVWEIISFLRILYVEIYGKKIHGTLHFPDWAKILVAMVSDIPQTHFATVLLEVGAITQE